MQEAEGCLRQCEVLVDRLGLFSPNEDVEDIATGDLKYLLVSQQHAEVVALAAGQEPHARRQVLMHALESHARCATPTGGTPSSPGIDHAICEARLVLCWLDSC